MADVTPKKGKTGNIVVDLPRPSASGRKNEKFRIQRAKKPVRKIREPLAEAVAKRKKAMYKTSSIVGREQSAGPHVRRHALSHGPDYGGSQSLLPVGPSLSVV